MPWETNDMSDSQYFKQLKYWQNREELDGIRREIENMEPKQKRKKRVNSKKGNFISRAINRLFGKK